MGLTSPPPAQITICGALNSALIAALVEVAMAAGAALLVQPRALPAPAPDVVEGVPRRSRALPPARRGPGAGKRRSARRLARVAAAPLDERVARALKGGPLPVAEFLARTGLNKYSARQLVSKGLLIATGATHSRHYALPGTAKEVP